MTIQSKKEFIRNISFVDEETKKSLKKNKAKKNKAKKNKAKK